MSKTEFLSAYTPPSCEWPNGQVPFINISHDDTSVIFTVRRGGEHQIQFTPVQIAVPMEDSLSLFHEAFQGVVAVLQQRDGVK